MNWTTTIILVTNVATIAATLTPITLSMKDGVPTQPSPYGDLTVCQQIEDQLLCFDDPDTLAYVIKEGVHHAVHRSRSNPDDPRLCP